MTTTTPDVPMVAPAGAAPAVSVADADWAAAVALLDGARRVVLACHVAPDGDALGSMLGLARALRSRGATVTCTWGDERWERPPAYAWLPGIEATVPPADAPADPDLLVVLDTSARDRLGVLAGRLEPAAVLVVDHHAHGADLPGVHVVDDAAAATAVVVEELLRRLGVELDEEIATCLYVGLVTDTGSFAHSVTTPAVHHVAARLLAAGARPDVVARRVWGTRPIGVVRLLAAALPRTVLEPAAAGGRGLIWTWTSAADLRGCAVGLDDVDAVMEAIRATGEADVAVVVKQDLDGAWKVSSRSRGGSDVGAACAALGGGGHRLAAGFTADEGLGEGGPEAVLQAFAARLA